LLVSPIGSIFLDERAIIGLSLRVIGWWIIIKDQPFPIGVILKHSVDVVADQNGKDEVYLFDQEVYALGDVLVREEEIVLDAA
jgi:hypothetical protein